MIKGKTKSTQKVSKRAVMKRAWAIFKQKLSNFKSFSECLARAWKVEKENLRDRIEKAIKIYLNADMSTTVAFCPSPESMQAYYNSNAYKGD